MTWLQWTEILWGCCIFIHSKVNIGLTIFYFYSVTALDCFPKLFIVAEERIEVNLQLFPPCNFEKLPDKKPETHTVVVALHSILCPRDLCWLFVACSDVFPYPPALCSSASGECKTCSGGGFGLQCVTSSFSPSLCFCPVKPGWIWCLFSKMARKIIPCYRRITECSNGEWGSTACLMGNEQMEPVSSNMKTLERH